MNGGTQRERERVSGWCTRPYYGRKGVSCLADGCLAAINRRDKKAKAPARRRLRFLRSAPLAGFGSRRRLPRRSPLDVGRKSTSTRIDRHTASGCGVFFWVGVGRHLGAGDLRRRAPEPDGVVRCGTGFYGLPPGWPLEAAPSASAWPCWPSGNRLAPAIIQGSHPPNIINKRTMKNRIRYWAMSIRRFQLEPSQSLKEKTGKLGRTVVYWVLLGFDRLLHDF